MRIWLIRIPWNIGCIRCIYKIEGDSSIVYYDSAKKQVQKMEQIVGENSSVTTFEYDGATKQISAMHISVMVELRRLRWT